MELNRTMILLSGCFLIVWSTFKWKIPHVIWDVKLTRVCSVILGLYNIILAICFEKDLSIFLFIVDLILYILLDIVFLMVKLKKDKKGTITYSFLVQGVGISAQVSLTLPQGSNKVSANISPSFHSNTLTMTGELVTQEKARVFEGFKR